MNSLKEAAQQALEAMCAADERFCVHDIQSHKLLAAIESLRSVLAQPDEKAQPVACRYRFAGADGDVWLWDTPRWQQQDPVEVMPVYAATLDQGDKAQPLAEQGAELSDEQVKLWLYEARQKGFGALDQAVYAVRAAVAADRVARGGSV